MRAAEWINAGYFSFFLILAWVRPLPAAHRRQAVILGGIGLALALASPFTPSVARDWIPAPAMLFAYWQAGRFFSLPNEKFQNWLLRFDRKLFVGQAFLPAWLRAYLEVAYLFCYPVVPLGMTVLYILHRGALADHFWMMVLPPTYLCYAMVAFLPTLPPRTLEADLRAPVRGFNLWIVRRLSIQVNTFPSAHVAASLSVALAMLQLARPAGWIFLWVAVSIAFGAVLGRYHYAADAMVAAMVSVGAFILAR